MSPAERSEHFAADLTSVRSGRHFVRDVLLDWGLAELVDDAQLCVSEIVTNAVTHAGTDLTIVVRRDDTEVCVDVHDGLALSGAGPEACARPLDATSGRGLHIVATISLAWGVRQADDATAGKVIWFRLPTPAATGRNGDAAVLSMAERRGTDDASGENPATDVRIAGREQARHVG